MMCVLTSFITLVLQLNVGEHIKNTSWFYERYLAAPEADALFSDIIRYICGVYHPTNAVLASTIVPRWVFIATLLRYVRVSAICLVNQDIASERLSV